MVGLITGHKRPHTPEHVIVVPLWFALMRLNETVLCSMHPVTLYSSSSKLTFNSTLCCFWAFRDSMGDVARI